MKKKKKKITETIKTIRFPNLHELGKKPLNTLLTQEATSFKKRRKNNSKTKLAKFV